MIIVSDSGPLIHLSEAGAAQLLPALFGTVLVPPAVWGEVMERGAGRPGSQLQNDEVWLVRRALGSPQPLQTLLAGSLDPGEVESILLALELRADRLLSDDLQARLAASRLGLPVLGTLGVLLLAKANGILPNVRTPIESMQRAGFWLSSGLVAKVLLQAGE